MIFEKYTPESGNNYAKNMLLEMIDNENLNEEAYIQMMKRRIEGKVADQCYDLYYIAHENDKCCSRLWHGWGKHELAVGNFGHFMTLPELRGQGIGKKLLEMWFEDLNNHLNPPAALFCGAAPRAAKLYFPYGFRPAIEGTDSGPLYMPIGDSPETFREFCEMYYTSATYLVSKPATVEWRHEIDRLLHFALKLHDIELGIGNVKTLEYALINCPESAKIIFTDQNRCVGWMIDGVAQIHPRYVGIKIL